MPVGRISSAPLHMLLLFLLCSTGCGQANTQTAAQPHEPQISSKTLTFVTADLAKGNRSGLGVAEDGSIVLKRKNLLRNASFEWDDYESRGIRDGLAADWGIWGKGYGTYSDKSVPYLPNEATHGTRSQRIELTAEGKEPLLLIQSVRGLKPNLPYTFSADVKIDDPKQVEAALGLQFYAADKWQSHKQGDWVAPTAYTRLNFTAVAPAGVDQIRPFIALRPKLPNAHGTLWVDAAQLEQSDKPTAFSAGYEEGPAEFISPAIDLSRCADPYKFSWIACQPSPTDLRFQLRSANTEAELSSAKWYGPPDADAYSTRIETGDNLIGDPSVETVVDGNSPQDPARIMGYGENDRKFTVVADAHDGKKALKVEITEYQSGDGRWHVRTEGPVQNDCEYAFSVWHRENPPTTPMRLSVTIEDSKGEKHWGQYSEQRDATTQWRQDTLFFHTPKEMEIKRLWVQASLSGVGWVISDLYCVRRVIGAEEWAVNPVHRGARWLQYRAIFKTYDSYYSPKLYKTELHCGASVPEVRWLNVVSHNDRRQKYSFQPGQTAVFKPQILDFTGQKNIESAELLLKDPSGKEALRAQMARGDVVSSEEVCFERQYPFPPDTPLGEWQATVNVRSKSGGTCTGTVLLKVRPPYRTAPQRMLIGALVDDYGFARYKGEALQKLIEKYKSCTGLEVWKLAVAWKRLEPTPGRFDDEVIAGFKTFIAAAHASGAKAQVTIQQQSFPDWANNGEWDSKNRYRYEQTKRLADTWARFTVALKDCPGLESYLLINEENCVYDADVYLRAMSKVAAAVRAVDPDLSHRITIRPNTRNPYLRTRIATDGSQDYDYGGGGYPTSSSWFYKKYASPVSPTSCLRMARLHESPLVFGGPGGIGEIGFFCRPPKDTFGDEEKLAGFQRAMQIAYEMGMDEFMLWGGGFSFDKPEVYFPKLIAFRDRLLKQPRPAGFDVRFLLDTDDPLYVEKPPASSELDMTEKQPFAAAFRFLDERGFVWYYTSPEAMAVHDAEASATDLFPEGRQALMPACLGKKTVKLSDLKGKTPLEQEQFLADTLRNLKPSGTPLPWPKQ